MTAVPTDLGARSKADVAAANNLSAQPACIDPGKSTQLPSSGDSDSDTLRKAVRIDCLWCVVAAGLEAIVRYVMRPSLLHNTAKKCNLSVWTLDDAGCDC